jgi:hypothetical protein
MSTGVVYYSNETKNVLLGEYVELSQTTVDNAMTYLNGSVSSKFQSELDKINSRISELENEKVEVENIRKSIEESETFYELSSIISRSGLSGVDLNKEVQKKDYTERAFDELINGKVTKYGRNGPIKKGGVGQLKRYCEAFNMTEIPDNSSISMSVDDPTDLVNEKDINIIDPYDPTDDISNLENDIEDGGFSDGDTNQEYVCEDSGVIKCMGDLDTALAGKINDIEIDSKKTLVYTIKPENRMVPRGRIKVKNKDNKEMSISLTENPLTTGKDTACRKILSNFATVTLAYNSRFISALCDIEESKTYFLRVKSDNSGKFDIITYGDGSNRGSGNDNGGGDGDGGDDQDPPEDLSSCKNSTDIICMDTVDTTVTGERRNVSKVTSRKHV